MAANCERSRYTTSVTKCSSAPGESMPLSLAAMAGAVMAGYISLSHVAPTGWAPGPQPHDLNTLIETLTPGGASASTI